MVACRLQDQLTRVRSPPELGRNLFTEMKWKKWAEFWITKKSSQFLFQKDFSNQASLTCRLHVCVCLLMLMQLLSCSVCWFFKEFPQNHCKKVFWTLTSQSRSVSWFLMWNISWQKIILLLFLIFSILNQKVWIWILKFLQVKFFMLLCNCPKSNEV